MPSKGGIHPLRAWATRFVEHKVAALERMIDRFGAYISHLIAMAEDSSVKPADKAKMKAYVKSGTTPWPCLVVPSSMNCSSHWPPMQGHSGE